MTQENAWDADYNARRYETDKRDQRSRWLWTGAAYIIITALVCTTVLVIVFFSLLKEHERTERVQACIKLSEPLERQYCLIAIGEPTTSGKDN